MNRVSAEPHLSGILVVDKPSGPSSFDVVRRVRGFFRGERVGHTGTLDPLATGVLPLCIGEATRLAGHVLEGDKVYLAAVKLGEVTDTQDAGGRVVQTRPVPALDRSVIEAALNRFRGTIQQTPPMYSAVKVHGRRLYALAREGQVVERAAREITIHQLELVSLALPVVQLRVACSKGTYVRTLGADLGESLGTGAHLVGLRRVRSGPFDESQAHRLDELMDMARRDARDLRAALLPVERAFESIERLDVDGPQVERYVRNGMPLPSPPGAVEGQLVRLHGPTGHMVALAKAERDRLIYVRVLPKAVEASLAG